MIDAVQARGVVVGLGLGVWRVLRCNPFNSGGYDPAPSVQETSRGQDVSRETI
ncbi:MAG: membrane protein insertion efficiency factor YidD [Chloroflexi bacterium]|nr:membrane protein insertion efficiency factor YidD [Chloroflexota bacterium]